MKLSARIKKYLYWLVSIISLVIITLSIYQYLGGFDEIRVVQSSNNTYSVAGKEFKGRQRSDSLNLLFREIKSLILNKELNGDLCIINYPKSDDENEIHQFVGVLMSDDIAEIPTGLKVIEYESETTFKVGLGMHPLVMPNSDKVEEIITQYAAGKGFELENYSMEILFSDNSIMVEMFAR
ncbi:MAG: hypothetical protein JXQ96_04255 [Cyclobacteriaceae bacterium]